MKEIEVFRLDPNAVIPTRAHSTDAGLDLYCVESIFIPVNNFELIKTGIAINIPEGYVGYIKDRSSIGLKGLSITGGVIDSGYCGPLNVIMNNLRCRLHSIYFNDDTDTYGYWFNARDKIAQLTIHKVECPMPKVVKKLWNSDRNDEGFGSSGT